MIFHVDNSKALDFPSDLKAPPHWSSNIIYFLNGFVHFPRVLPYLSKERVALANHQAVLNSKSLHYYIPKHDNWPDVYQKNTRFNAANLSR